MPGSTSDCARDDLPIISYHIHVLYRGNNVSNIKEAVAAHAAFIAYFNASMAECTHPHMDPSPGQQVVCHFPWSGPSIADMAEDHGGFFNMPNYAFFIPKAQYVDAIEWWRRHSGRLDFIVHTNSGCQDPDHTLWPVAKTWNGWNPRSLEKEGLICCHTGPAGCRCDIASYAVGGAAAAAFPVGARCLNAQGLGAQLTIESCNGDRHQLIRKHVRAKGYLAAQHVAAVEMNTTWRETVYDVSGDARGYSQIENMGHDHINTYECMGIRAKDTAQSLCAAGAEVVLTLCADSDKSGTRWSWLPTGHLASDTCPGMCAASSSSSNGVVLANCTDSSASWKRL